MASFSRRQLARYAVDELLAKNSPADIANHLAAALITAKKQKEADLLLDDVAEQLESRGLLARAIVTSANKLSSELKERLGKQIKDAAQVKELSLREQIDPDVIGGVRIETASHTWDRTIARKLSEIKGGL